MLRIETRFLFDDIGALRDLLSQRGTLNAYSLTTSYLDTPDGTWSKNSSLPRFRLRQYSDGSMFMETKLGLGRNLYAKARRRVSAQPDGLVSLGLSAYTRTEWSRGNLRVTIDVGLTDGTRTFKRYIVEVKQPIDGKVPNWLKQALPKPSTFSKWAWITS